MSASLECWMNLATAYELLSLGFIVPSPQVAEALVSGEFAAACTDTCGKEFPQLAAYEGDAATTDEVFHRIRVEYTRLFVGERTPLITPYAGVKTALDKGKQGVLFVGPESMAIERFMRRSGVAKDLSAGQSNDPVDHMGTMCEFLKYLCLINAQAIAAPEGITVEEGEFAGFFLLHFEPYAKWCAEQLAAQAQIPFYVGLGELLTSTLELSNEVIK